jgi:hypothetical protein
MAPKRNAEKVARPRPAAGDDEENHSASPQAKKKWLCSLQKSLVHDGLVVTPPDDTKAPESTQHEKSNHRKIR